MTMPFMILKRKLWSVDESSYVCHKFVQKLQMQVLQEDVLIQPMVVLGSFDKDTDSLSLLFFDSQTVLS